MPWMLHIDPRYSAADCDGFIVCVHYKKKNGTNQKKNGLPNDALKSQISASSLASMRHIVV